MPRKLEAQFDGRYLMSNVLMTSTMKSEPATPPMRLPSACGVPTSAAMACAFGGSADGSRAAAVLPATVAFAACGATALAAPAAATAVRKLRRSTFGPESLAPKPLRAMMHSLAWIVVRRLSVRRVAGGDCIAGQFVAPVLIATISAQLAALGRPAGTWNFSGRRASNRVRRSI